MEYIRKIDIEIDREYINYTSVRQNDSARAILFHLHANGTDYPLKNRSVRAWGVKPDGTKVFIDLEIVNSTKGQCKLRLTNNILAKVGELKLMLTIAEGEDILSTSPISIDIKESLRDDEAVESTNEFTALENSLKSVDMWNTYFEKTSGNIEEKYATRLNKIGNMLPRKCKASFGIAPWWVSGTSRQKIEEDIIKNKNIGCKEMPIIVHIGINNDNKFYTKENIDDMYFAYEKCKENGIKISMIKFHEDFNTANLLLNRLEEFKAYWKTQLEAWAKKFEGCNIPYFTVMNELKMIYNNSTYDDFLIECLEIPKNRGFKAGISTMGIQENFNFSTNLNNAVDCYFCNIYPVISYNGQNATYEESVRAWDTQIMLSSELKKNGKPMIMSETGCQDRWSALSNPGRYDWPNIDGTPTQGLAPVLFLYGLFNSGITDYYTSITYWYYDALRFDCCKQIIAECTGVV